MRAEPAYLPTPHQIAASCQKIRANWSPEERERRLVGCRGTVSELRWYPPRINATPASGRVRKEMTELTG